MSESERLGLAPEARAPEPERRGFWGKLKKGLLMTHTELLDRIEAAVEGRAVIDEETLEVLEESLLAADIGVETSLELVERIRRDARRFEGGDLLRLRQRLVDELAVLLMDAPPPPEESGSEVILMVGVNGVGKTTSAAKLAAWHRDRGRRVLLAAADTFRAAAIDQLALWGERLEIDVVRHRPGADPGAVVFDALQAARARGADRVLVDTAGRMHTRENLMAELGKIGRVIERQAPDWARRTLLVLDATTGQNALSQAEEFTRVVPVDGLLLAKIDGTAKGGVVVSVARKLRLPVLFLGVGEAADDLIEFRPREFAAALLG